MLLLRFDKQWNGKIIFLYFAAYSGYLFSSSFWDHFLFGILEKVIQMEIQYLLSDPLQLIQVLDDWISPKDEEKRMIDIKEFMNLKYCLKDE